MAGPANPQPQQGGFTQLVGSVARTVITVFIIRSVLSYVSPRPTATGAPEMPLQFNQEVLIDEDAVNGNEEMKRLNFLRQKSLNGEIKLSHRFLHPLKDGDELNLKVYISKHASRNETDILVWEESTLYFDSMDTNNREINITVPVDEHLLHNGTMFLHAVLRRVVGDLHGKSLEITRSYRLTRARVMPKIKNARNLLNSDGTAADPNIAASEGLLEVNDGSEDVGLDDDLVEKIDPSEFTDGDIEHEVPADFQSTPTIWKTRAGIYQTVWPSKLDIATVIDRAEFQGMGAIPEQLRKYYRTLEHPEQYDLPLYQNFGSSAAILAYYEPILLISDFWVLATDWIPINNTLTELPLQLTYSGMASWKLMLYEGFEQSMDMHHSMGTMAASERDEIKRMYLETNPYLLAITMIVSILHTLFDFLAFKNDVKFWKNNKSMEGLSMRTILFNSGTSFIIFLYLLDNETSWMILLSSGVGCIIEGWKLTRALDIRFSRKTDSSSSSSSAEGNSDSATSGVRIEKASTSSATPSTGVASAENRSDDIGDTEEYERTVVANARNWLSWTRSYRLTITARASYSQSETKGFDDEAMRYLVYLLYPLAIGYSIYSLVYDTHKSWYSWLLSSVVGTIYTFGFIMMTPQLFINYRMKSVAHMPWKVMIYKSLNTFIDDLFAFVIKMPILHRLSCFRDDIIFFIFLYQRWIYPVDKTRRNEFGQVAEPEAAAADATSQPSSIAGVPSSATESVPEPESTAETSATNAAPATPDTLRRRRQ